VLTAAVASMLAVTIGFGVNIAQLYNMRPHDRQDRPQGRAGALHGVPAVER
jgi:hypothetical protein